jgi:hypothetical protein
MITLYLLINRKSRFFLSHESIKAEHMDVVREVMEFTKGKRKNYKQT